MIAYASFVENGDRYAYHTGGLTVRPNQLMVVTLKTGHHKLVRCVGIADVDNSATATIFGVVQEQP